MKTYELTYDDIFNKKILEIPEGYERVYSNLTNNHPDSKIEKIIIPKSIKIICHHCFSSFKNLKEIELNEGLEEIENCAFSGCKKLKKIILPNTLKSVGSYAFYNCNKLEEINLENLVYLGNEAFTKTNIKQIKIGKDAQFFPNTAFECCNNVKEIIVNPENKIFDSRNNCNSLIDTASNILYLGCKTSKIPDTVKSIHTKAFTGIKFDSIIKIPNIRIQTDAFLKCTFKKLDVRNNIDLLKNNSVSETLIINDNQILKGIDSSQLPENILVDGSVDVFIKNNKKFYTYIKGECNIQSIRLDEIIKTSTIREANKIIKEAKEFNYER